MKIKNKNKNKAEYSELCKTIRRWQRNNDNERQIKTAIGSRESYKKAKNSLLVGKKQIVALINNNERITSRRKIRSFVTEYHSKVVSSRYKFPKKREDITSPRRGIPRGFRSGGRSQRNEEWKSRRMWRHNNRNAKMGLKSLGIIRRLPTHQTIPEVGNKANKILLRKKGSKREH